MEFWMLLTICLTVGWVITTWIRARHGYPVEDTFGGHVSPHKHVDSEALKSDLLKEINARDTSIANLRERVEVLERIVTDRAGQLQDEIQRLSA